MKIMRGRKMKIGIGNDHVAVEMKNEIKAYLEKKVMRSLISVQIQQRDVTILNMVKLWQMLLLQVKLTVVF